MNTRIDYRLIADAMTHYEIAGYKVVEVPWVVARRTTRITFAGDPIALKHGLDLVGSGEQGFLEMIQTPDELAPGQYVACTPCFRDDTPDDLHQTYFIKVELYRTDDTSTEALVEMIRGAAHFFRRYTDGKVMTVRTSQGWDIELDGVEIGSYGRRTHEGHTWLYGTGLALPRFSIADNSFG